METEGKAAIQKSSIILIISRNTEVTVNQEERGTQKGLDHEEPHRPWKSV